MGDNYAVFEEIKKRFTEDLYSVVVSDFIPVAEALLASTSPHYLGETARGWTHSIEKKAQSFTITFGSNVPQALFSEYGTISKFSPNTIVVDGQMIHSESVQPPRGSYPDKGMTAAEAIKAWCEFKGIENWYGIYMKIMKYGRNSSMPEQGMGSALPAIYNEFKIVSAEVINGFI